MKRTAPWYRDAFILVTVAKSHDAYQHPRVSVVKLYQGRGLPKEEMYKNPTSDAQTLISFEFQQNVREGSDRDGGEPWLQLQPRNPDEKGTGPAYGGHLDTTVRVEQWGVDFEAPARLRSVDAALKKYRKLLQSLGVQGSACDCTTLVQALRTSWKLPVLFVAYWSTHRVFGSGRHFAKVDPDPNFPTAQAIEIEETRASQGAH